MYMYMYIYIYIYIYPRCPEMAVGGDAGPYPAAIIGSRFVKEPGLC